MNAFEALCISGVSTIECAEPKFHEVYRMLYKLKIPVNINDNVGSDSYRRIFILANEHFQIQ